MSTPEEEQFYFNNEVDRVKSFFARPRFRFTKRPYTAKDVASLRGTLTPQPLSGHTATKLYNLLRSNFNNGTFIHTFGSLDPVQVVQMSKYLKCIYVSGWQCSSTASTTNEPGPDFADYPSNTVSNKVDQLFKAQLFHDRKQREERSRMSLNEKKNKKRIDFLRPIIADGDCGFGGVTAIMKLMKCMIEAGAAGVHIEDQKAGAKKCGHLGGKVLVPISEQYNRLSAFRLQADIMGVETVVISRTDAVSAVYLENNIDPRDHPFIAGTPLKDIEPFTASKDKAKWLKDAQLIRYPNLIANAMKKDGKIKLANDFLKKAMTLSHTNARQLASNLGYGSIYWNQEKARSNEGYFRIIGGTDYATLRARCFTDLADVIWMETMTPNLKQCMEFSKGVHKDFPNQILSYNLSPSFNWDAKTPTFNMTENDIRNFQKDIGKLGFSWQFITLAGFHLNAVAVDKFAKAYSEEGVIKYVQMIQREERRLGVETLTHQKWSGTELQDRALQVATGGLASTAATEHSTEGQFTKSKL